MSERICAVCEHTASEHVRDKYPPRVFSFQEVHPEAPFYCPCCNTGTCRYFTLEQGEEILNIGNRSMIDCYWLRRYMDEWRERLDAREKGLPVKFSHGDDFSPSPSDGDEDDVEDEGDSPGITASIPVYLSRHTPNLPDPYGAFISWEIGEHVRIKSKHGRPDGFAIIKSETKTSAEAPIIDGARGKGRWVREVWMDDEKFAISEEQIYFK